MNIVLLYFMMEIFDFFKYYIMKTKKMIKCPEIKLNLKLVLRFQC